MVGGGRGPCADPGCVEERKQLSRCPVTIGRTYELVVVGEKTSWVRGSVINVEVPKNKCRQVMLREQINRTK